MSESNAELHFNALTDAWLPLVQNDGTTVFASPVEVLCGEKDGIDLDYPRDDFRVYARLLLSALVQALFPAKNKGELKLRLEVPLARADIERRIKPALAEFDLFGDTPFLQVVPPKDQQKKKGAAPFVFGIADLYQPMVRVEAISLPIALVALFAEQTYAGGGGSGHIAGPGGQPGAFTLIDSGSIRSTAWANSLTLERIQGRYASDEDCAWSNVKRAPKPRASIGIVEGLFFQPRGIWLLPVGEGACSFSGRAGTLVRLSPFLAKSELTTKPITGEDVWVHPCAPLAVNSQGIAAIRLNAKRPAWTGLAQLLAPLSSRKAKIMHPLEGPALVLTQWKDLNLKSKDRRLIVLDFDRDKANVKRRFFEAFPLTASLVNKGELVDLLRVLIADTQEIAYALETALTRAHDDRKAGGLALADARSSFWATSEDPFLDWLAAVVAADEDSDAGWGQIQRSRAMMLDVLRKTAMAIFNAHAELSEFDPRKQQRVARARRALLKALWPRQASVIPPTQSIEVSP
jgi:CRISPR type I-E-associated protein CasA/Cse1